MGDFLVCVYAICKNESRFALRWMESMREADRVFVLDTGSEDDTVERLEKLGAHVTKTRFGPPDGTQPSGAGTLPPWRFDDARNRSLALVPEDADICVCTDLDETFHPGWREKVEEAWRAGADRLKYRYTWSFNPDGSEGVVFWIDKIHARRGFRWQNPVHEVLVCDGACRSVFAEGVQLDHHADDSKPRGQYLPLLELAVREDPRNDRNMHYLGREYLFHGDWQACADTLRRHLAMPEATWADERCASMRFLARAEQMLGHAADAERWHLRACAEAPHLREPWLDYAKFLYLREDFEGMAFLARKALAIAERPRSYICEADAWGFLPYDLLALAYFYTGRKADALEAARKAVRLAPFDERLRQNAEKIAALQEQAEKPGNS